MPSRSLEFIVKSRLTSCSRAESDMEVRLASIIRHEHLETKYLLPKINASSERLFQVQNTIVW